MLGFTVSPEELKVFIEEVDELTVRMEALILQLEKERSSPKAIAELFRIAHTIKGGAASIGYEGMAKLSHHLESLLEALRQEKIEINPALIDLLLRTLDALRNFNKSLRENKRYPVDLSLQEALQAYAKLSPALGDQPKETLVLIQVQFSAECDMPGVRAFQVLLELKKLGDIIESIPSAASIEKGDFGANELMVRFDSKIDAFEIKRILENVSDVIGVTIKTVESKKVSESDDFSPLKSAGTLRVDIGLFDNLMNLAGELVIGKTRLLNVVGDLQERGEGGILGETLLSTAQQLSKITAELQSEVMKARLVPVQTMTGKFPRAVRDLAVRSKKEVECVIEGADTQLDRSVLERVIEPMIHILRNAVDHGIELPEERKRLGKSARGVIKISARHQENHVVISVHDDGRGINLKKVKEKGIRLGLLDQSKSSTEADLLELLFTPGFSTAETVTEISGRGVGLDVVKSEIQKIGGMVQVESREGQGTTFTVFIPLTLAILSGLKVKVNGSTFIVPLNSIQEIVKIAASELKTVGGKEAIVLRDAVIPIFWLGEIFDKPFPAFSETHSIVIVSSAEKRTGILVDSCLGNDEVVIKSIDSSVGELPGIGGATVLGDGSIALVLDIPTLIGRVGRKKALAA